MFDPVEGSVHFPALEAEIGKFWRRQRIYEQSLERPAPNGPFIFYEGPPTANGMPHPGHCLTRAIKDLFPRYRTMRGYLCERKAGWDTHGLPVEVEVCKELGIHSKEEIEAYGVEPFIHKCQESVWRYMQQWERLTERLGFWVDLDEAYVTYHQSYIESVWWALEEPVRSRAALPGAQDRLVVGPRGHGAQLRRSRPGLSRSGRSERVCPVSAASNERPESDEDRCSSGPPRPGRCRAISSPPFIRTLEYSVVASMPRSATETDHGQSALVETIAGEDRIANSDGRRRRCKGAELVGRRYRPPFDYYYQHAGRETGPAEDRRRRQHLAWRVVPAEFVTVDSGTGVVHQAPAFGEVDFEVLAVRASAGSSPEQGPELICAVGPDGKFTAEAPDYTGRWVKEADKDITPRAAPPRTAVPSRTVSARVSRSAGGPKKIR